MPGQEEAEKYVVCHTMVNDWPQGTVIHRDALRVPRGRDAYGRKSTQMHTGEETPEHDQLERLLALGAIRPAAGHEASLAKVPVPQAGLSTEAQLQLGTLDAQIEQLTRTVSGLQERLAFHQTVGGAAPAEDPAIAGAVAERTARVEHLSGLVESLQQQLDEAQGATRAKDEAAGKAASEARGGREQATGQAPPLEAPGQGGASAPEASPPPPEPERPKRSRRGRDAEEQPAGEMFPPAEEPKG